MAEDESPQDTNLIAAFIRPHIHITDAFGQIQIHTSIYTHRPIIQAAEC